MDPLLFKGRKFDIRIFVLMSSKKVKAKKVISDEEGGGNEVYLKVSFFLATFVMLGFEEVYNH